MSISGGSSKGASGGIQAYSQLSSCGQAESHIDADENLFSTKGFREIIGEGI